MISVNQTALTLRELGARLRRARIARNESMALFADRIGVSVPTLRALEQGRPSVQVGHLANALWALGALRSLDLVLAAQESLIDRARAREKTRLRPYRRSRAGA
jgi:transcriptional regulator with XRE-family HTH domain